MSTVKAKNKTTTDTPPLRIDPSEWARLVATDHAHPHSVLGAHPATSGETSGVVVRAFHPDATGIDCLLEGGEKIALDRVEEGGLFATFLEGARLPLTYRLRFRFADGNVWERGDPYRFTPTLGDMDLHLFNEGNHRRLWERLGSHLRRIEGVDGVAFAVWAPNARRGCFPCGRWEARACSSFSSRT